MGVSISDVATALFWLRSCHRIIDLWMETAHEVIWDVPLLMRIYSLLCVSQCLVLSIVQMTQVSTASLEGLFRSLTDLAVRILFPVIFLLKVPLLTLVIYAFCGTLMRNRTVGIWHLFLTYSANSCYTIFDDPDQPCPPWCLSPHTPLQGLQSSFQLRQPDRCLWTLEGGRMEELDAQIHFSTSFSFWTNPLSFGMNVMHLQWYLRVRLLKLCGNVENNNYS